MSDTSTVNGADTDTSVDADTRTGVDISDVDADGFVQSNGVFIDGGIDQNVEWATRRGLSFLGTFAGALMMFIVASLYYGVPVTTQFEYIVVVILLFCGGMIGAGVVFSIPGNITNVRSMALQAGQSEFGDSMVITRGDSESNTHVILTGVPDDSDEEEITNAYVAVRLLRGTEVVDVAVVSRASVAFNDLLGSSDTERPSVTVTDDETGETWTFSIDIAKDPDFFDWYLESLSA